MSATALSHRTDRPFMSCLQRRSATAQINPPCRVCNGAQPPHRSTLHVVSVTALSHRTDRPSMSCLQRRSATAQIDPPCRVCNGAQPPHRSTLHVVSVTALSHRTDRPSISAMSSLLGLSPKCVQLVIMWPRSHVTAPHIQFFSPGSPTGVSLPGWLPVPSALGLPSDHSGAVLLGRCHISL